MRYDKRQRTGGNRTGNARARQIGGVRTYLDELSRYWFIHRLSYL
jgi:hypothetical protein